MWTETTGFLQSFSASDVSMQGISIGSPSNTSIGAPRRISSSSFNVISLKPIKGVVCKFAAQRLGGADDANRSTAAYGRRDATMGDGSKHILR